MTRPAGRDYKLRRAGGEVSPPLAFIDITPDTIADCRPPAGREQHGQYVFRQEGHARQIARRTEVNKARRSRLRTSVRKVEEAIASGDRNKALAALKEAEPSSCASAQKGIVHSNAASRKVSRLTKRVAKLGK